MIPIEFTGPSSFEFCYDNQLDKRVKGYLEKDVELANNIVRGIRSGTKYPKKVIYSGNKTIVFWNDKTKTIVSCGEGEQWDPYTGFCAALAKKLYGSTSHTKKLLKKVSVDKRAVAEKIDP